MSECSEVLEKIFFGCGIRLINLGVNLKVCKSFSSSLYNEKHTRFVNKPFRRSGALLGNAARQDLLLEGSV